MVYFTLATGIAMLASLTSVTAAPTTSNALVARQAAPNQCSEYCSVAAGCVNICRPANCAATYLVQSGDTCHSVVSEFNNFTATDLYNWNPEIGTTCFGIRAHVPVCIGVPGYSYPGPIEGGDIYTPEQTPIPVQPGIVANCTKFEYTDNNGKPTRAQIWAENGITQEQWNGWNFPTQNATGDYFAWANYFSCVKA
ncbi:hypothetical protein CC80DRAFT_496303 [Byssothecium circinans]|uniref:LysM domain-containing protein n=1 Tax=Byssothecium circinans TaxID=147558 RepID=A0A6A5TFP6_9PLEO|nr:hypothetical protein CC80DRAFT_496303 [Byssothecium circinans]